MNIMTIKFMNPLYFWVGDYPDNIEICLTELGEKDKVLLYFLELHLFIISFIHC